MQDWDNWDIPNDVPNDTKDVPNDTAEIIIRDKEEERKEEKERAKQLIGSISGSCRNILFTLLNSGNIIPEQILAGNFDFGYLRDIAKDITTPVIKVIDYGKIKYYIIQDNRLTIVDNSKKYDFFIKYVKNQKKMLIDSMNLIQKSISLENGEQEIGKTK